MTGYERGRTATYRLYDDAGSLLYVGVAALPSVRFKQHAASKDWWSQVASHSEAWFDSREEALAEEASAIATEIPLHNINRWTYDKPAPESRSVNPLVTVQAARTHLRDHIDVGLEKGEHTVITRTGRPVAVLVPYSWYQRIQNQPVKCRSCGQAIEANEIGASSGPDYHVCGDCMSLAEADQ